jgi:hypothetical protein
MTNTVATVDEVWGWLHQPLQDLKQGYSADPNKSWEDRRRDFLEQLGLSQPSDHDVAEALLHRLDELSDDDRNALLAGDEIDTVAYQIVQDSAPEPSAEPDTYDEAAWHQFLATNLPSWSGTEAAWGQFSEWFTYHAGQAGLSSPAQAFVDHLAALSNDQRIATCAQYGVTIAAPAAEAAPVAATGEMSALMAEILKERPEFAAIPEARRLELIAEVLAEADEDEDEGED